MQKSRFWGGVHPLGTESGGKAQTSSLEVQPFSPKTVCIPMNMHLGAPSTPCVRAGDPVKKGQVIAEGCGSLGVTVHASVSGRVTEVSQACPGVPAAIMIENDFKDEWVELKPVGDVESCDPEAILPAISAAGLCGMGGAGFPTHIKMCIPCGDKCDLVLLNGAECETHMTSDHRLMVEQPERVVNGLRAAMRAFGAARGIIAIEDNKPDAISAITKAAGGRQGVRVETLATRYPQGGEKQLIQAVTGKEVPSGGLPIALGVVVLNVSTAAAIEDAVELGKPLVERIITVTGRVAKPANLLVPIGTTVGDALDFCGGLTGDAKVVMGGAMMGVCAVGPEVPITKVMDGMVALPPEEFPDASPCIRCGRCSVVCPAGLVPYEMEAYILADSLDRAKAIGVMDCILCGSCSYICPAQRKLAPAFKDARARIVAEGRRP